MGRIAYVNGRYVPHGDAAVHIEDRGYQFADGVYEVIAVYRGCLIDEQDHIDRLDRSLRELEPRAWELLRTGLTASRQDHPLDEITVRVVTGFGVDELQRQFDAYCAREAERLGFVARQEQLRRASSTPTDN